MPEITLDFVQRLYGKYQAPLQRVRALARAIYRTHATPAGVPAAVNRVLSRLRQRPLLRDRRMVPQFDDIEAEITYMLLREARPETVVEISPCDGWSTIWVLCALRDNERGQLTSYDIHARSQRNVPSELAVGRWTFVLGDVRATFRPVPIDYLLIDSDHSAEFCQWYLAHVFPQVRAGAFVSVDDMYHRADPGHFPEGPVLVGWLEQRGIAAFTASSAKDPAAARALGATKTALGLGELIHSADKNAALFFTMPSAS